MTTKDEALRKALEALELLVDVDGRQTEQALDYGDNAIDAIREALAEQPAQQHIEHCLWARNGNQPCHRITVEEVAK